MTPKSREKRSKGQRLFAATASCASSQAGSLESLCVYEENFGVRAETPLPTAFTLLTFEWASISCQHHNLPGLSEMKPGTRCEGVCFLLAAINPVLNLNARLQSRRGQKLWIKQSQH